MDDCGLQHVPGLGLKPPTYPQEASLGRVEQIVGFGSCHSQEAEAQRGAWGSLDSQGWWQKVESKLLPAPETAGRAWE